MRAVVQRVFDARVVVDAEIVGEIDEGLLVYLGVAHDDDSKTSLTMARKVGGLRIFADEAGKMSRSVIDEGGQVLLVSQFTLLGDARRGRRPSFTAAAPPERAKVLYLEVARQLRELGLGVETGRFQATMDVQSRVDGPVTLLLDTDKLF